MSLETIVQGGMQSGMESGKFHLLLDILKILERHPNPQMQESVAEIIDSYDESLTSEQKAAVLKEFLNFKNAGRDDDRRRRFEEEVRKQQIKDFMGGMRYD